jgi:hypothetical protein
MTDTIRPQQLGQRRSAQMGRPLGSRDRFPRGTAKTSKVALLETALGERDRQIADLERELAEYRCPVPDDAVALLDATMKGTYQPSFLQWRSAVVLFDRDWDRQRGELDAERASLDQERVEYHRGDEVLEHLIDRFKRFSADRDDELAQLVEAGAVTPAAAKAIRAWFVEVEEERLALPAPAAPSVAQREDATAVLPTPPPSARPARLQATLRRCPGTSLSPHRACSSTATEHSSHSRWPPAAATRRIAPVRSSRRRPIPTTSRI